MSTQKDDPDVFRLFAIIFSILGTGFVIRTIRYGTFDAGGHGHALIVSRSQDPSLFWSVVGLVSLLTAAALYCAVAPNKRKK